MDLLQLQTICGLAALLLLSFWWLISKKSGKVKAPELAGAWPVIGHLHLLGGSVPLHKFLAEASDKCGPAFTLRFGIRSMFVVSGWEVAKECFTTNDRVLASRSPSMGGKYLGYNYALFTFSPYGSYWRDLRKIATLELLSNRRLEMLKHVRIMEIDTCIKELYTRSGVQVQPIRVEMKQWFEDLTFNVVVVMITGKRYIGSSNIEDGVDIRRFQKALNQFLFLLKSSAPLIAFPFLEWFDFGGYKGAMKCTAAECDSVLSSWLEEHRHRKGERNADFIDVMISILEGGEFPDHDHDHDTIIKATCLGMILGGTETTTSTLTWILSLLLNNYQVLRNLQNELDTHVGKDRCVGDSDIPNLIYLQAVVKETLRLYPPLPLSVPHEAMEDCTIGGFSVRAGTRVMVNLWKIHRDSGVWSDPLEFRPERFLLNHVDVDMRGKHFELIPFGSGRRSCPGTTFALQVIHLTLARLLHSFNVSTLSDSPVDMSEKVGGTVSKATPLDVILTPRLQSKCYL